MEKILIRTLTRNSKGKTIVERVNTKTRKIIEKFTLNKKKEKDGLYQKFNYDGILYLEINYTKNKKDGLFIKNNKKGKPILRVEYKNDLKNGLYQSYWHSNNNLCEESTWIHGLLNGEYKIYEEYTGKLKYHREYKHNKLIKDFLEKE